jgi:hypothetical protein
LDAWFFGLYYVDDKVINASVGNGLDGNLSEWLLVIWLYALHLVWHMRKESHYVDRGLKCMQTALGYVNVNLKHNIKFIFSELTNKVSCNKIYDRNG